MTQHHATPQQTSTQHADDLAAMRQAALDYMRGWYEGDAERMRRCRHPELAKRVIPRDPQTGEERFRHLNRQQMVEKTRQGGGTDDVPAEQRSYDVAVLDIRGDIASARAESYEYIDYLHLARSEGRWVLVNVLWTYNPTRR